MLVLIQIAVLSPCVCRQHSAANTVDESFWCSHVDILGTDALKHELDAADARLRGRVPATRCLDRRRRAPQRSVFSGRRRPRT